MPKGVMRSLEADGFVIANGERDMPKGVMRSLNF